MIHKTLTQYTMTKAVFKTYNQGQVSLFPKSLDEKIPIDSPTRLINQIVEELNIDSLINTYLGAVLAVIIPG